MPGVHKLFRSTLSGERGREASSARGFYVNMPDSIRPGKLHLRGARGGRKVQQAKRHGGKENEESDYSMEEGEL